MSGIVRPRASKRPAAYECDAAFRRIATRLRRGVAHVRVEVAAAPAAPGRPGDRFASMIEVLWSLGALGRVNAKGMPDALWLAAIAREYRDVIRFVKPPAAVQPALFGPLAALARRTGRVPLAEQLHGPEAPCCIPEPGRGRPRRAARPAGRRTRGAPW